MNVQEILKDSAKIEKICSGYFYSVDKNKNGVLEFKEIKNILAKFAEDTDTIQEPEEQIKAAFNQLDSNNDGKISYDEFKTLFQNYLTNYGKK